MGVTVKVSFIHTLVNEVHESLSFGGVWLSCPEPDPAAAQVYLYPGVPGFDGSTDTMIFFVCPRQMVVV